MNAIEQNSGSFQILVVDDTPENISILKVILSKEGYNISVALSGEIALNILTRSLPDLILMDVMMPGMNGFEVCRKIKEDSRTCEIPVIFVTAKAETDDIVQAFDAGGVDYITKPYQYKEILSRIKTHLKMQSLLKRNSALIEELKNANAELENISRKDPLTGLSNRRDMNEKIENELARFNRSKESFSIILGDIDYFKKTNDTYGHDAGDDILVKVSNLMAEATRAQDVVARWGGEEFLILLPNTDLDGSWNLAEIIRKKIENEEMIFAQNKIPVTMSFGTSCYEDGLSINELVKKADECLYRAKEAGRNKVVR